MALARNPVTPFKFGAPEDPLRFYAAAGRHKSIENKGIKFMST
jgi:hypothetical protein